jgi:hypothetical protein
MFILYSVFSFNTVYCYEKTSKVNLVCKLFFGTWDSISAISKTNLRFKCLVKVFSPALTVIAYRWMCWAYTGKIRVESEREKLFLDIVCKLYLSLRVVFSAASKKRSQGCFFLFHINEWINETVEVIVPCVKSFFRSLFCVLCSKKWSVQFRLRYFCLGGFLLMAGMKRSVPITVLLPRGFFAYGGKKSHSIRTVQWNALSF